MRRAVQALVIGGVLLPAAACGIATGPTTAAPVGAPAATSAAAPAADGSIRSSCEALGQVYGKNLAPFAEALTDLVAARQKAGSDKEPRAEVRRSLTEFASAIRAATSASTDPQLRADGERTAEQIQAKADDAGFVGAVKTSEDVNTVLGPTLKQWLSPVAQHCS
ncbi:hypothetical protein ACFQFC_38425 [Amorphoplanes digitatis]|uniref:Lipoprotein n=1 Tax=Actinoplanes digitatis TaxID=1868 RepID=A0A7W7HWI0_9ACTN|nr:hypothetical protein [Actinoplanes digitatis]MBB4762042.1 hypothetical protein [Actinoplanes digitatis]GID97013.1 hypothetical protein Adi01nite_64250 [Actinoplanes digitatis]